MTDKWPLWVVERYYDEMGWVAIGHSLSNTKGKTKVEYLRTVGYRLRRAKDEANPQEGDCRLSLCRIEVKP